MKKLLILLLLISFSGYTQTYQLDHGSVAGQPVTFMDGSFIHLERGVVQLHITTYSKPRFSVYGIMDDETDVSYDRTIRKLRLIDALNSNLRIQATIVSSPTLKPIISVTVYDMNTQINLPYVIYTK